MENQMMNMSVKSVNEHKINKPGREHASCLSPYTWRKEWVRPYESMFSILRNFCKVNVLNGRKALNLFEIRQAHNVSVFCSGLMMFSDSPIHIDCYQKLYESLLPDWYLEQTFIFRNSGIEEKESLQIRSRVSYCPECMKENYHSLLHNIAGAKICPFHKTELIQTDLLYEISSIYIDLHADGKWNVANNILPCDRTKQQSFYSQIRIPEYDYFLPVIRATHHESDYRYQMEPLINGESERAHIIFVNHCQNTPAEFNRKFTEWFNSMQLPYDATSVSSLLMLASSLKGILQFPQYYIDRYLYYKICKSAEQMKLKHFIRKTPELFYTGDMNIDISYKQEELLCCSFIYAVVSCNRFRDAFRANWLHSRTNNHIFNYRGIRDMHLAYLGEDIPENFTKISAVDGLNIALKILDDQYDFLYDEYKRLAYRNGNINGYTGWKSICLPEYYVTRLRGCSNFKIYRYWNDITI